MSWFRPQFVISLLTTATVHLCSGSGKEHHLWFVTSQLKISWFRLKFVITLLFDRWLGLRKRLSANCDVTANIQQLILALVYDIIIWQQLFSIWCKDYLRIVTSRLTISWSRPQLSFKTAVLRLRKKSSANLTNNQLLPASVSDRLCCATQLI